MRILITGAGGYLGRGMWEAFEGHELRLMDIKPFDSSHEVVVGDVRDLEAARAAVAGVDGIVMAHMAPRNPDAYLTPVVSFDVNVKGTANLFHVAVEKGVKRVVVISSTGATVGHAAEEDRDIYPHTTPPKSRGMYGLTKVLQEVIAEQYSREHGLSVSVLRMAHIVDESVLVDKYGKAITQYSPWFTDRRDIGEVARLCLERADIKYEVFNVINTEEGLEKWDVKHTCDFLGWKPRHDFKTLPKKQAGDR